MAKRKVSRGKKTTRKAAGAASDAGANKRLARRWFDQVWNKRREKAIEEMMSPKCVGHGKAPDGGDTIGAEGFKSFHRAYLSAFPDLRVNVEDVIVEGRKVVVRWVASGTHQGDGLGFPATLKPMRIIGMSIVQVRGGQIVEGWDSYDQHGMLQQLGLTSRPEGSRAL